MPYFKDEEFRCKCGNCPVKPPDPSLLARLNGLRGAYGKPIYITSGWRCVEHNKKSGGDPASSHLTGKAADLFCTNSRDRYNLLFHVLGMFRRVGIGNTFIHVDTDDQKAQEVVWLYDLH